MRENNKIKCKSRKKECFLLLHERKMNVFLATFEREIKCDHEIYDEICLALIGNSIDLTINKRIIIVKIIL